MGLKDPVARRAYAAKQREANRDQIREYGARYREKHREAERLKQRTWVAENKERRRAWEAEYRKREHVREQRRLGKDRWRAIFRDAFVEQISRKIVWQRDEGICGICGEPTDPNEWELDHVIALAKGGTHEYANVQVSHPDCNRRKGAS